MTWISLDCALPEHPKMAVLPNDTARYGWVCTLLAAKRQAVQGQFASTQHYREVMPSRFAKHLPDYLAAGLLEDQGGALVVHDWTQYQWKAAKQRQREDKSRTKTGHTETVTRTETTTGSLEPSLRTRGEPQRLADLLPGVVEKLV